MGRSRKTNLKFKGKRGQLAFIAVLIMLIIIFFIFRANKEGYDFMVYMGDSQAVLLETFQSTEEAKIYVKHAARQAVYDALYNSSVTDENCKNKISTACTDNFKEYLGDSFSDYANFYGPSGFVSIDLPDFKLDIKCESNNVKIEGFGYDASCEDITPFPQEYCEDISDKETCEDVIWYDPVSDKEGTPACKWSASAGMCDDDGDGEEPFCIHQAKIAPCGLDVKGCIDYATCIATPECVWLGCSDATRNPTDKGEEVDCYSYDESQCNSISGCHWEEVYPEYVTAISEPLLDFQFNVYADAHFKEEVSCEAYSTVYPLLKILANVLPTCEVKHSPAAPTTASNITFTATYTDPEDEAPSVIQLIIDGKTYGLEEVSNETVYSDGKEYQYVTTLTKGDYTYYAECQDKTHEKKPAVKSAKKIVKVTEPEPE